MKDQYDKIVNFLYEESDEISKTLINCYQDLGQSNKDFKKIHLIMKEYTDKDDFYKYIQKNFKIEDLYNINEEIIKKIQLIYKKYNKEKIKIYNNSRWL